MTHDVTQWLLELARGSEAAAQQIWERYYEKLVRLARRRLTHSRRRERDEEDVALSAFNSFCRGAAGGRFPRLTDRDDLWKILVTLVSRKAVAQLRREHAEKRGGGRVRGDSIFGSPDSSSMPAGIGAVMGTEPSPELALLVAEECEELLDRLGDDTLRRIALLKLEGHGNEEIAETIGRGVRTVEQKLARIRDKWAPDADEACGEHSAPRKA